MGTLHRPWSRLGVLLSHMFEPCRSLFLSLASLAVLPSRAMPADLARVVHRHLGVGDPHARAPLYPVLLRTAQGVVVLRRSQLSASASASAPPLPPSSPVTAHPHPPTSAGRAAAEPPPSTNLGFGGTLVIEDGPA